jgi:hypothetical protein
MAADFRGGNVSTAISLPTHNLIRCDGIADASTAILIQSRVVLNFLIWLNRSKRVLLNRLRRLLHFGRGT